VTTDEGLTRTDEARVEIYLPPRPPEPETDVGTGADGPTIEPPVPPANGQTDEPAEDEPVTSGELRLTAVSLGDPVRVGEQTKFSVTLENDRTVSDNNLRLTFVLPAGVKLDRLIGKVGIRSSSADGLNLKLEPIAELRPREKVNFRVIVTAKRAGKYEFTARVESRRSPDPITVEEDLTINVE
jgi:hypothetical protein